MQINKIHQYNVLNIPWPIEDNSVDCCVTSPPYYGLRDYGEENQLGLEETPEEYISNMVTVFNEVKRVLKSDGTLWLNIGDSYNGSGKASGRTWEDGKIPNMSGKQSSNTGSIISGRTDVKNLKPKDLIGIPWMLAFALRSAGWYLRQDIIWHKPNPMPESVTDRCTKSHEYIFLLSKSTKYYFDAKSIATPYKDKTLSTYTAERKGYGDGSGLIFSENLAKDIPIRKPKSWKSPDGWDTGKGSHGSFHKNGREKGRKGYEHRGDGDKKIDGHSGNFDSDGNLIGDGLANRKSVWTIATAPFPEAHFATFPEEIPTICIKAGCPPPRFSNRSIYGSRHNSLGCTKPGKGFHWFGTKSRLHQNSK